MTPKSIAEYWDKEFDKEFSKESDRAAVIISEAMMEQALGTLLKAYLVPTDSSKDSLFDGAYALIGNFNAKIDLAHRTGLISTRFCRDLHIIRKIRNDFAHNVKSCNFEDSAVRSRVTELVRSSSIIECKPNIRKGYPEGIRGDFQMVVSWMLWRLTATSETIHPISPSDIEWGYWTKEMFEEADKQASK